MRPVLSVVLVLFIGLATSAILAHDAEPQRAYVEKVYDGDAVLIRLLLSGDKVKARILGIECSESHRDQKCHRDAKAGRHGCDWQVPRGLDAFKFAARLLKRKTIILERDKKCQKDRYGRLLRYIGMADGKDSGLEMVRAGMREDFGFKYSHPRGKEYLKFQGEAKRAGSLVGITRH